MASKQRIVHFALLVLIACSDDVPQSSGRRDAGSEGDQEEDVEPEDAASTSEDPIFDADVEAVLDAAILTMEESGILEDAAFGAPVDAATDAGSGEIDVAALFGCVARKNNIPDTLECTGLYQNLMTKQVAGNVREFRPGVTLWSNGADKTRWIYLPPGATIDASNPREWVFPVGTKFWKEFRVGGRRIETRFLNKIGAGNWLRGAYRWAKDELSAARYDSATSEIFTTEDGTKYHIPAPVQCDDCHNGRKDFVMGFESVALGLDGATGITLQSLADEGRLSPKPSTTHYAIATPDGGTSDAAQAMAWVHVNCGVSCHNANPKAKANSFDLHLRLDPDQLASGSLPDSTWDILASTVNVAAKSRTGAGGVRIVPHQPDASMIVQLISGSPSMPYLDTVGVNVPDPDAIALVRAWISAMPANPSDGGVQDGGISDAGNSDGGNLDAGVGPGDGGRPGRDASGPPDAAGLLDAADAESVAPDAESDAETDTDAESDACVMDLDGACAPPI